MTKAGGTIENGLKSGTTGTAIMIGTVITGTKIVVIIADANTPTLAPLAGPTGDTIGIVKTTDAETPAALQKKEAATIIPQTLEDIDHDISLKEPIKGTSPAVTAFLLTLLL